MEKIRQALARFKSRFPAVYQFIAFGLIGTSAVVVLLIGYYLSLWAGLDKQLANFIGYMLCTAYQYLLNFVFVFGSQETKRAGTAVKFFALYLAMYAMSAGLLYVFVDLLHVSKWLAPVLNSLATTLPSFFGSKYWVFRKPKGAR